MQIHTRHLHFLTVVFIAAVIGLLITAVYNNHGNGNKEGRAAIKNSIERKQLEPATKADSIVAFAKTLIGSPYKYASATPAGFDCSGFVYYVYHKFNVVLTRSSYTIANEGEIIDSAEARKADIILFQGTDLSNPDVGHIGIIISEEDEPIRFIHSSSGKKHNGVTISSLSDGNYADRYIKIIRVIPLE